MSVDKIKVSLKTTRINAKTSIVEYYKGEPGKDGKDGKDGEKGEPGKGITDELLKEIKDNTAGLINFGEEIEKARGGKETLELKLIDMENRASENVAKQYLEVTTDTGHMKVENCYNGNTKDLAIKGRTLHNLISEYHFGDGINEGNGFVKCVAGSGWKATRMQSLAINLLKPSTQYTVVTEITKNTLNGLFLCECWRRTRC